MRSLPKPLIGLLLGTVAFFAIWMVALKPHSSASGGGVGQYQPAINQAHQAVTTSNQANAKLGAPTATTSATTPAATTHATTAPAKATAKPVTTTKAAPTTKAKAAPTTKPTAQSASAAAAAAAQTVATAIRAGNVVAILFYNDAAADDRAVKTELAAIPTHGGHVVKVAVPVSQLIQFSSLTRTVDINTAPELVLIDHARQASTLVGYADSVEIAQRIDDALATK
jgi:cytoskeletal protein RodZ